MPFNARRLRKLREKRGLTQKELADKLNIDYQRIQEYEGSAGKKKVKPGADRLEKLVNALQTNMDYLMSRSEYDGVLTDRHQRLAVAFDEGDTETILRLIREKALEEDRNKGSLPGGNPPAKTNSLEGRKRFAKTPRIIKDRKKLV